MLKKEITKYIMKQVITTGALKLGTRLPSQGSTPSYHLHSRKIIAMNDSKM